MSKILSKFKFILLIFLVMAFLPIFTGASCEKTAETPLSEEDLATLRYHREAKIEDNFEDNSVYVIFKSSFEDLEEISFKDLAIVEKVVHISYVDLYSEKIPYSKNGKIPLKNASFKIMFDIVFEEHSKEKVLQAIELLNSLDMVLSAGAKFIDECVDLFMPNDPGRWNQWNMDSIGCDLKEAWDITRGSTDVKVGIMEDNIDINHEDLKGRVHYGNFTPSSNTDSKHGTIVAGVLGAIQDNGIGMAGVAQCSMYLLNRADLVGSINYAKQNGINIINASFGTTYNDNHYKAISDYDGLLIAAAGNSNYDNDGDTKHRTIFYPASYDLPNIISVGAMDRNSERAVVQSGEGSNYGKTTVDLFAPGKEIYSTLPDNKYTDILSFASGTSIAVPHVAGVAALIYAKCPDITAQAVKYFILKNVDKVDGLEDLCVTGGKLNAYKAVSDADLHDYTCTYVNSKQHQMKCEICTKYYLEDHTFAFLSSKSNSMDINKVQLRKICTGCGYVSYGDIGYVPITKDEEEQFVD